MSRDPFPVWPVFDEEIISRVSDVLRSGKVNYWTGDEGKKFEAEFASFCGCEFGVAVANGTLALELALASFNIGAGDEVIVTSRSFIASASCIVVRGATPVLADVDSQSQNITVETIKPLITKRTKAIIAVHLGGWPCDMDPIMEMANERGIKVIEDCAQAHGAKYKGRSVGSLGHAAAFSFCQDKIMSTGGEGGMLTTNDFKVWSKAWSYKDHGKDYNSVYNKKHPPGYRWLHDSFGTNWRLTEMQSAIGRLLIQRLPKWIERRRQNARILDKNFSRLEALRVCSVPDDFYNSYYKYYTFVKPEKLKTGWNRDRIMQNICAEKVPCFNTYSGPICNDKAFVDAGLLPNTSLPKATELGETCLQFLVHPTMTEKDMHDICEVVHKVLTSASG